MNEGNTKKREWVKNAAIIFLALMLVLTFFSNTIMNYSLPEVSTQYVTSGTITAKIRGTGTIEANDPYHVVIKESRVIDSVLIKTGDVVEEGDTLFLLEESESTELKEAERKLADLVMAYEKELLSGNITAATIKKVESGNVSSLEGYINQINAAADKVNAASTNVNNYQANVTYIEKQIALLETSTADVTAETTALNVAKTNLTNARAELTNADNKLSSVLTGANPPMNYAEAESAYNALLLQDGADAATTVAALAIKNAYSARDNAQVKVTNCEAAVTNAEAAITNKQGAANKDATLTNLRIQLVEARDVLAKAEAELMKQEETQNELIGNIQGELNLKAQLKSIEDQQAELDKLRASVTSSVIEAPVSGTILSISYVSGETTRADEAMAVIQPSDKGFTLSIPVTVEQAKKVSVGDAAEIDNNWYYSEIKATLAAIKADPDNPSKNKLLVFNVTGDVQGGQTLSISVGQKSSNYDLIVPNSAIREDSNGKFVLLVEAKSSPLGTRYIATRIDVEILASDDTQSAIAGALYGWGENVITTSTKPVEAGKQVRLAD